MKIVPRKELFWFLRDGVELDLSRPRTLEMYVQQVISCGRTEDIKDLLTNVRIEQFAGVFPKIKRYVSAEVRAFWEDYLADHQ